MEPCSHRLHTTTVARENFAEGLETHGGAKAHVHGTRDLVDSRRPLGLDLFFGGRGDGVAISTANYYYL